MIYVGAVDHDNGQEQPFPDVSKQTITQEFTADMTLKVSVEKFTHRAEMKMSSINILEVQKYVMGMVTSQ